MIVHTVCNILVSSNSILEIKVICNLCNMTNIEFKAMLGYLGKIKEHSEM